MVIKGTAGGQGGLDGVKSLVQGFHVAFPDLHFNIDDQIAEDNRVVTLLTIEGTNTGEFMGMPASNRRISTRAISVWLVGEGKLVEEWTMFDTLDWMRQLGAVAGPESVEV